MNEDAYLSDEEELECPLCMEEFDISDRTFKPCPCGYQICRFCYNRIVNSETANGCPACRRQYTEETVEFKPLSAEEWKRDQQRIHSRKLKEKEKRESEMASRRHLSNMRVVQKNLVYVIGFSPKSADADLAATLRGNDYFAQYGKINKIVVNKKSHPNGQPTVGVYITYARKEDAARAVQAVDNTINDGRVLRASFGTTKYCSAYLRQQVCQNPNCMYLHEPGEDLDSYTREDMSTIQHAAKAAEGMHANALAAHHMRRQPSRADSTSTMNQEESAQAMALPASVSWASSPRPMETPAQEAGPISQQRVEHSKPDSLPAPARDGRTAQGEIPPPPSQAAQNTVIQSDSPALLTQPGFDHPILGPTLKKLFEGRFNFQFVPRVMPGLSEADIKSAESFPQLFSWNPQPRRPMSPSKANKNHARSGSRYAFAADSKTPPPGFVPPGLATGLQPPGFSAGSPPQGKEGTTEFFSQFLKNASTDNTAPGLSAYADPAIVGLQESGKSSAEPALKSAEQSKASVVLSQVTPNDTSPDSFQIPAHTQERYNLISKMSEGSAKSPSGSLSRAESYNLSGKPDSPANDRAHSKFGVTFAKLEDLETKAQNIAHLQDQQIRANWEPTSRPRDNRDPTQALSATELKLDAQQQPLSLTKSSGTWQPSPPPPRISVSPKAVTNNAALKVGPSLRNANRVPWEPSPPPTTNRTGSPLKTSQSMKVPEARSLVDVRGSENREFIHNPVPRLPEKGQSLLADDEFPDLKSAMQNDPPIVAPTAHTPSKKMWNVVPPVAAIPIPNNSSKASKGMERRDSTQSVNIIAQDRARSRQNSNVEVPSSKMTTPIRGMSPTTSPVSSRAASPAPSHTPTLARSLSTLSTTPAVSSPLAIPKTGKQIRIVSSKTTDDTKAKAEKIAAEERAIQKIKDGESAAAAKSMIRKSVPASSVKKSKEQKAAEQREKAERRDLESVASSQAEDTSEPTEIAPITGRARKQKNKQAAPKTPVKTPVKAAPTPEPALTPEADEIEPEPVADNKTAASDAISELSKEMDLRKSKFFLPIPALNYNYEISKEELTRAAETAQWVGYKGKETIEQLEVMLSQARKESGETMKALEKLQRRNIKLARLDVPISI